MNWIKKESALSVIDKIVRTAVKLSTDQEIELDVIENMVEDAHEDLVQEVTSKLTAEGILVV